MSAGPRPASRSARSVGARSADRATAASASAGPSLARPRFWFNATLRDRDFFLAALAGMLLTNFCLSVTALGLVGERESGTTRLEEAVAAFAHHHGVPVVETVAGKSTLVSLLARYYDVSSGTVLLDGVDVREWDLGRLRRHVGIIFQDPVLFTGTVEANLAVDGDGAGATLERALQTANAAALVARLPLFNPERKTA